MNINESKVPSNDDLWKYLQDQIAKLKKETIEEYKTNPKQQSQFFNSNLNTFKNEFGFNDNVYKIPTRLIDKPKQMTLQELTQAKIENLNRMKELESEIKQEQLNKLNENRRTKRKNLRIYRKGYDKDIPLDDNDLNYIQKYEDYLQRKEELNERGNYEEEWNITRINSTNSNGIVNRKDDLPGYFIWNDYSTYYQSLKNNYK